MYASGSIRTCRNRLIVRQPGCRDCYATPAERDDPRPATLGLADRRRPHLPMRGRWAPAHLCTDPYADSDVGASVELSSPLLPGPPIAGPGGRPHLAGSCTQWTDIQTSAGKPRRCVNLLTPKKPFARKPLYGIAQSFDLWSQLVDEVFPEEAAKLNASIAPFLGNHLHIPNLATVGSLQLIFARSVDRNQPVVQPFRGKQNELSVGVVSLLHPQVQLWKLVLGRLFCNVGQPIKPSIHRQQKSLDRSQSAFFRFLYQSRTNSHSLDASCGISSEQPASNSGSGCNQGSVQGTFSRLAIPCEGNPR